jgi:hypothetical protein
MSRLALAFGLLLLARPEEVPPGGDPTDLVNVLLSSVLGFRESSGDELQNEVAEIGGVAFQRTVPLEYLDRRELAAYLQEVLASEYPPARAEADARMLVAFGLLEPGTDLRILRARLLEENIAGFYDDRPGRKRLYAVSADRRLTPANQLILAHELRHALQDQYMDTHAVLSDSIGDFDDRRLALLALLEGDATLLMERYLMRRIPGGEELGEDLGGLSMPTPPVEGAPPVLRDQLVLPYTAGLDFARSLWQRGGWGAIRSAWERPPKSTEQVLHPTKYVSDEVPRSVVLTYAPPRGRVVSEGVLGEILVRTLLGDEASPEAAAGWGGDAFRVWDLSGKTLLVWRVMWDTTADGSEFARAFRERLTASQGVGVRRGRFEVFGKGGWRFAIAEGSAETLLASSDDDQALQSALAGLER